MEIVNWKLASHPINWLTIVLMLFIAMIAVHLGLRMWQNSA